jgi:septum formation protein
MIKGLQHLSVRAMPTNAALILASTSPYRRELLTRLGLPFEIEAPDVDETPRPAESPAQTAQRLALAKARAVAARRPNALVIGADQTATLDGMVIVGKPGDHPGAVFQLRAASGRTMHFHSGLALIQGNREQACVVDTVVAYRRLADAAIERYVVRERPYDCTGSAKVEASGIALLEWVRSDDPTALIGLPLIALTSMLAEFGRPPLGDNSV